MKNFRIIPRMIMFLKNHHSKKESTYETHTHPVLSRSAYDL